MADNPNPANGKPAYSPAVLDALQAFSKLRLAWAKTTPATYDAEMLELRRLSKAAKLAAAAAEQDVLAARNATTGSLTKDRLHQHLVEQMLTGPTLRAEAIVIGEFGVDVYRCYKSARRELGGKRRGTIRGELPFCGPRPLTGFVPAYVVPQNGFSREAASFARMVNKQVTAVEAVICVLANTQIDVPRITFRLSLSIGSGSGLAA